MPAIQPARLKSESSSLAAQFGKPATFIKALHQLLDFYADRTHRPGRTGTPPPLLPAYRVPQPVLRQVEKDLKPLIAAHPADALALADALWGEQNLECRRLAVHLLARAPVDPPEPILERLQAWAGPAQEERLLEALLEEGTAGLRSARPELVLKLIQTWLKHEETAYQAIGLQALKPLVADPGFSNLPAVFQLIRTRTQWAPKPLRPFLRDVLFHLAGRSPQETAYFLVQCLASSTDSGTAGLVRACMDQFSPELQAELRRALRP